MTVKSGAGDAVAQTTARSPTLWSSGAPGKLGDFSFFSPPSFEQDRGAEKDTVPSQ